MPRGRKSELAALKRPGDKGTIKKTKSGKFQPQIFIIESGGQRALGSFSTAEEAAAALAAANDKRCIDEEEGAGLRCAGADVQAGAWHGALRPAPACAFDCLCMRARCMRSPCADCLCISSRRRV